MDMVFAKVRIMESILNIDFCGINESCFRKCGVNDSLFDANQTKNQSYR